jgi:hypothetical protein
MDLFAEELEALAEMSRNRAAFLTAIAEDERVAPEDREMAALLAQFRAARARAFDTEAAHVERDEVRCAAALNAGQMNDGLLPAN